MYLPESFKIADQQEIEAFVRKYDFATIVSPTPESLIATHVPVIVRREGAGLVVRGHVARANVHWKYMNGTAESLLVFNGLHGYVSPTWYASAPAVPTWNYAVVHAYGRPHSREDQPFIEDVLDELLRRHEF